MFERFGCCPSPYLFVKLGHLSTNHKIAFAHYGGDVVECVAQTMRCLEKYRSGRFLRDLLDQSTTLPTRCREEAV